MKKTRAEVGLERLLVALEREILEETDEEILAAARELGMNPGMKGSAALAGVTVLPPVGIYSRGAKASPFGPDWTRTRKEKERPRSKEGSGATAAKRPRRRVKGDEPSSN